jgi:sialate O-acetylesterase
LAGFLWYQGEGNVARAGEYAELFQTLIRQWRADFAQGDRPFLFVQLAGYSDPKDRTGEAWAWLRSAQESALVLKNTGMAVAIDVGDSANIHPVNKQAVGARLARVALRQTYGMNIDDRGPMLVSMKTEGSDLRLRFTNAAQLTLQGDPGGAFVVAGKDHRFLAANAKVLGDDVVVSSAKVPVPVAVRYNWNDFPHGVLRNADGLPVAPFRSDSW